MALFKRCSHLILPLKPNVIEKIYPYKIILYGYIFSMTSSCNGKMQCEQRLKRAILASYHEGWICEQHYHSPLLVRCLNLNLLIYCWLGRCWNRYLDVPSCSPMIRITSSSDTWGKES